jgi:hypothetical protein
MKRIQRSPLCLIGTKPAIVAALLAMLTVAAYWGGRLAFVHVYAEEAISVRPYVMEYDSIVTHDGVEKVVGHTTESRRHDGAMHYIGTHYGQSPKQNDATFRRVDFPDGTTALISDAVHAKSTGRRPQDDVARQNASNFFDRTGPDCSSKGGARETIEGKDTLFGYSAVRISQLTGKDKATQDAGLSRVVAWRLPDFNCVVAQDFSQVRANKNDEWKTTLGNRLTGITATEPDPALFTNWQNYDEMKPSDIGRRIAIAQGLTPQTCPRCFAPDPSDVNYKKWHESERSDK